MKRTRLNPISRKRQRENVERRDNLERAWGPRPWSCYLSYQQGKAVHPYSVNPVIIPACMGRVDGHELLKRSQGGSITDPSNMVPLCSRHNGWVEDEPDAAYDLGLVRKRGEL